VAVLAQSGAPIVGEIRTLAIDPRNESTVAAMRRAGWAEANGQLLPRLDFPELFDAIGRLWTPERMAADQFALPDLTRPAIRNRSTSSDALGDGDRVTGGRRLPAAPGSLSYWVYVGRDTTSIGTRGQK
jgi:microcystin-dependent protein